MPENPYPPGSTLHNWWVLNRALADFGRALADAFRPTVTAMDRLAVVLAGLQHAHREAEVRHGLHVGLALIGVLGLLAAALHLLGWA